MELMESYIKNGKKKRAKRLPVVMWNVCRGNGEPRPDLRNYRHCWIEPEIKDVLASVHRLLPSLATALQTSAAEFLKQSGEDEPCLTTGFADYHSVTSTSTNKPTHRSHQRSSRSAALNTRSSRRSTRRVNG